MRQRTRDAVEVVATRRKAKAKTVSARDVVGANLRDVFAGSALTGLIACGPPDVSVPPDESECQTLARYAYVYADAMMVARVKR